MLVMNSRTLTQDTSNLRSPTGSASLTLAREVAHSISDLPMMEVHARGENPLGVFPRQQSYRDRIPPEDQITKRIRHNAYHATLDG